jgi:CpeT/CpcT family (DUF1001)
VHLRLWHRPLPFQMGGNLALFAEQSNALFLDQPYRQRVIMLQTTENPQQLRAQYFGFKQPDRFRGAGANPDRLSSLKQDDLELLPGCWLMITRTADKFQAQPEPGAKCCFQYQGKTGQVVLGFEASQNQFYSFDRGVDPDSGRSLWGALMGAYEFTKQQDFSAELPLSQS